MNNNDHSNESESDWNETLEMMKKWVNDNDPSNEGESRWNEALENWRNSVNNNNPSNGFVSYATELAELKELIGKLWKSTDAFKLASQDEHKRTQDQLAQWTQINLRLLDLLSDKTLETQRLAENFDKLNICFSSFNQELTELGSQIEALSSGLQQLNPNSFNDNFKDQSIHPDRLQKSIARLETQIQKAMELQPTPVAMEWNWSRPLSTMSFALTFSVLIFLGWNTFSTETSLSHIKQRVEWSLIKLERLENSQ
ncbi:hypothetical protein IQ268_16875 [Oculatella sp. LEGE 06141]|uniref:hypothetical protein n=1 Tax=Oculatella sp. LEGE 06141 TaxID=1828648 RepID=UPI0018825D44|nr:hypothetical protein [Oculatella sp. LEGE 06141]MBE9180239.1 hypothetical protein [Oculatella sp. LEGE 06141]